MFALSVSSVGDELLLAVMSPEILSRMIGVSLVSPGVDSFTSVKRVRPSKSTNEMLGHPM